MCHVIKILHTDNVANFAGIRDLLRRRVAQADMTDETLALKLGKRRDLTLGVAPALRRLFRARETPELTDQLKREGKRGREEVQLPAIRPRVARHARGCPRLPNSGRVRIRAG